MLFRSQSVGQIGLAILALDADVQAAGLCIAQVGAGADLVVLLLDVYKRQTVARASNPKNRELLHTLGLDTVVCGTDNLSHILEREIETDTIRQLLSLGGGTASLNEILLDVYKRQE